MELDYNNILKKIIELFNKYGIRSVTMDDVAAELGISKKTLYQYFEDKNELVTKVVEFQHEQRALLYFKVYEKNLSALDELVELHELMLKYLNSYSKIFEYDLKKYFSDLYKLRYEKGEQRMLEGIKSNLLKGKKEGVYRKEINESLIARYKTEYIMNMPDFHVIEPEYPVEYFNEVFKMHIYGILNKDGIEIYENIILKKEQKEIV